MISILIPRKNEPGIHELIEKLEQRFPGSQVIISNDRYGKGKGWALRQALAHAKGDIICFLDGDGDIEPRMIMRLLPFLEDYDIVVGRKQVRGLISRRFLTLCSRLYIWIIFGINYDSQTGIKVFKRKALKNWHSDSFAFDIEVLANAQMDGFTIIEVPVDVTISRRMSFKSIIKCFIESLKIRRRE